MAVFNNVQLKHIQKELVDFLDNVEHFDEQISYDLANFELIVASDYNLLEKEIEAIIQKFDNFTLMRWLWHIAKE